MGNESSPVQIGVQLALFLANRPGALGEVCGVLAKAAVNIHALTTSDTVDHVVIRVVVDKPRVALRALEAHGTLVVESEVILFEGSNRAGSLGDIARILSDAKVNIEYAYCATPPSSKRGLLVLRPSNVGKALKALNEAK
jgi:hypothetical protein